MSRVRSKSVTSSPRKNLIRALPLSAAAPVPSSTRPQAPPTSPPVPQSLSSAPKDRVFATRLQLGLLTGPNEFAPKFNCSRGISIHANDSRKRLDIELWPFDDSGAHRYRLEAEIKDLEQGCLTVQDDGEHRGCAWITLQMKIPPIVYRIVPNPNLETEVGAERLSPKVEFRRATDLRPPNTRSASTTEGSVGTSSLNSLTPDLSASKPRVQLGKWLIARLHLNHFNSRGPLAVFLNTLSQYNIYVPKLNIQMSTLAVLGESFQCTARWTDYGIKLHFSVSYLLESTLSFNYLVEDNITAEFILLLSRLDHLKASNILERILSRGERIWDPLHYLQDMISRYQGSSGPPRMVPANTILLRKVAVTPTTMYLMPPSVETSNRIIRKYASYQDFFLRVEFTDEGRERLWAREGSINTALFNRIFACLIDGICIGDRLYEFLAFSSSQLRENAAWFYCSDDGKNPTPDDIRDWMGDFSQIHSIAKYGARMGQCFSSTKPVRELPPDSVHLVKDIKRGDAIFSDGCGLISPALAKFITARLDLDAAPSAFQIRLGGSKGVLAVAPRDAPAAANLDPNKAWVIIRDSMKKFDSNYTMLEIIRTSRFTPAYLNRQAILLMSALGVPDHVFLTLKNKMVHDLSKMELNDAVAYNVLMSQPDEEGTYRMMTSMIRAGFLREGDLMLRNMIKLCKLHMLEDLSKRARIHVPHGAFLYGVVDETSLLNENEIFVQVSSLENLNSRRVIVGDCVLFRNPCFHPGDIRRVKAVDILELRDLHDVVVFNTKGCRSLPSMCSGGDLDGDEYTVLWDEAIVQRVQQHEPMNSQGQMSLIKNNVTIYDIQKFFVQYVVANNLGSIANSHLALADQLPKGPLDGKCLRLAELHSNAVDFPKTGIPAAMNPDLRPKKYPDFMEKPKNRSYISNKVLGVLYRECGTNEIFVPLQEHIKVDTRLVVPGHEQFEAEARELKTLYDREMLCLCNQYGIQSELEVVSGFIVTMQATGHRREFEFRRKVSTTFHGIRKMFRTLFYEADPQQQPLSGTHKLPLTQLTRSMMQKASAWYLVSYRDWQPGQPFTFAWCIWDVLCEVAAASSASSSAAPTLQGLTGASRSLVQRIQGTCPRPSSVAVTPSMEGDPHAVPSLVISTATLTIEEHFDHYPKRCRPLQVMTTNLPPHSPGSVASKPHVQGSTPSSGSPVSPRNRLLINECGLLQSGTMIAATRQTTWDQYVEKERQEFSKQGGLASVTISKATTIVVDASAEQSGQEDQHQQQQQQHPHRYQQDLAGLSNATAEHPRFYEHPTATLASIVSPSPPLLSNTSPPPTPMGYGSSQQLRSDAGTGESGGRTQQDTAAILRVQQIDAVLEEGELDAKRRLMKLEKEEGFAINRSNVNDEEDYSSIATGTFFNDHDVFVIGADVPGVAIAEALELVDSK
ncbi:hypothetical protein DFQ26_006029 [Actinomortierella ambigua]|nr:hypothetical protein DFQ26_006029 [Actinomortierella ambigua]